MKENKKIIFSLMIFFITVFVSCADEQSSKNKAVGLNGTDTGGGGTAQEIQRAVYGLYREHLIKELTRVATDDVANGGTIKSSVQGFFVSMGYFINDVSEANKAILIDMYDKGVVKNIRTTKINIGKCFDSDGIKRSATSPMNEINGDICFDPEEVADSYGMFVPDSVLIALFVHEFAHHYGYEDKDYALAVEVAKIIEKSSQDIMLDGGNPNNLIRPFYIEIKK